MITRRWFSRMMPAAAAAPALLRAAPPTQVMEKVAMGTRRNLGLAGQIGAQIMRPAGLDAFHTASNAVYQSKRYMGMLAEMQRCGAPDPNIKALKSVSEQHKYRMQLDQRIKRDKEEESFFDKLKDAFGVREYFKKMHEGNGAQPVEFTGRGGY